MRIAIIGAGSVGKKLGVLAHGAGYEVVFGVRSPRDLGHFTVTSIAGAVLESDFILLAIPFAACADCLPPLAKDIAGKIVVDVTNPLNPDWSPLLLGETNSAAQSISALLPGSHVIKAFNTVFADVMTVDRINRGGCVITAFIAGDDGTACARVAEFAERIGFAPRIVGALPLARYLEGIAHLNIAIAIGQAGGTNAAFIYDQKSLKGG